MVRQQRLGQQDHEQMTENMRLRDGGILAWRRLQSNAALEMLEGDFDAPSCRRHAFRMTQTVEVASSGGREGRGVERGDKDQPFGRQKGFRPYRFAFVFGCAPCFFD